MLKKKFFKLISSFLEHCDLITIIKSSKIYNQLILKNIWDTNGCKLTIGESSVKGLQIKNRGLNNEIIIADYSNINNCSIYIHGNNNKIFIGNYASLNQVSLHMEDSKNEISIGSHTSLCGKAHLATIEGTKICIGENCLFSSDLHFRTGDSHSILNEKGERINHSQNIIIEDHVWIGTKVTCLKGVHISKDSVVAATTTLCKKYDESNVIIGGVPGKIIKTNITWTTKRI